jgi:hypothetical protein
MPQRRKSAENVFPNFKMVIVNGMGNGTGIVHTNFNARQCE